MTNKEFFKEKILDIACSVRCFGFSKSDNTVHACGDMKCADCKFNGKDSDTKGCTQATREWCNEEYVEPCPFETGELVEVSDDKEVWELRYFAFAENGVYYTFRLGETSGDTVSWWFCQKYGTLGGLRKVCQKYGTLGGLVKK